MRISLNAFLEQAGFNVWVVGSGREVFEVYLDHQKEVDILMLEADLPDLSAPEFYERFRRVFPAVPCCFFAAAPGGHNTSEVRTMGAAVVLWPTPLEWVSDVLRKAILARSPS